jgi:signal transduction histidine kinase
MTPKDALRRSALFSNLSDRELDEVASIISERVVESGETLIREGEEAYSLFILEEGSVDVSRRGAEGSQSRITELAEGAIFGEMSFVSALAHSADSHRLRSAGVVAHNRGKILELPYAALEQLAAQDPVLGVKLYRTLALSLNQKLLSTTDHILPLIASARLAALGQMTANIVHELNNPLSVLRAFSGRISESLKESKPDLAEIVTWSDKISSTVSRINRVIGGLSAVSRNGGTDPATGFNPTVAVGDTIDFCEQRFQSHSIQVEVRSAERCPPVFCRPVQFSQAILNLLNNAVDAVSALPETKARWIHVEIAEAPRGVAIAVTDSGAGVRADQADQIFKPFFTTKGLGHGTGLGLSISRQMMEANGGTLELMPGSSRFVITLPQAEG